MAAHLHRKSMTPGLPVLSARNMEQRWLRYKRKFVQVAKMRKTATGVGLTKAELASKMSIQSKIEKLCPHYNRMFAIFGKKANVRPPATLELGGNPSSSNGQCPFSEDDERDSVALIQWSDAEVDRDDEDHGEQQGVDTAEDSDGSNSTCILDSESGSQIVVADNRESLPYCTTQDELGNGFPNELDAHEERCDRILEDLEDLQNGGLMEINSDAENVDPNEVCCALLVYLEFY